ncbi:hypothetical protein C8J56DRAFT_912790 [Mycena floridula]|nr:hypothetical protein C8J56DRAFT_912790 [Mycena floridula]
MPLPEPSPVRRPPSLDSLNDDVLNIIVEFLDELDEDDPFGYEPLETKQNLSLISRRFRVVCVNHLFRTILWTQQPDTGTWRMIPQTLFPHFRKFCLRFHQDFSKHKSMLTRELTSIFSQSPRIRHFECEARRSSEDQPLEPWAGLATSLARLPELHVVEFHGFRWTLPAEVPSSIALPRSITQFSSSRPNRPPGDLVSSQPYSVWRGLPRDAVLDKGEALSLAQILIASSTTLQVLTLPGEKSAFAALSQTSWPRLRELTFLGFPPAFDAGPLFSLFQRRQRETALPSLEKLEIRLARPILKRWLILPPQIEPDIHPQAVNQDTELVASATLSDISTVLIPDPLQDSILIVTQHKALSHSNKNDRRTPLPTVNLNPIVDFLKDVARGTINCLCGRWLTNLRDMDAEIAAVSGERTHAESDKEVVMPTEDNTVEDRAADEVNTTSVESTVMTRTPDVLDTASFFSSSSSSCNDGPLLPNLQSLYISNPAVDDGFWDELSSGHRLEELILVGHPHLTYHSGRMDDELYLMEHADLSSLPSSDLQVILQKIRVTDLTVLQIGFRSGPDDSPLTRFIAAACPNIHTLHIHRYSEVTELPGQSNLALSIDGLRSLCSPLAAMQTLRILNLDVVFIDTSLVEEPDRPTTPDRRASNQARTERAKLILALIPQLDNVGFSTIRRPRLVFFWQKYYIDTSANSGIREVDEGECQTDHRILE